MNKQQRDFLASMTRPQAIRLMRKFRDDPAVAFAAGDAAFDAFRQAFELVYPDSYIQHRHMAAGHEFSAIYMGD